MCKGQEKNYFRNGIHVFLGLCQTDSIQVRLDQPVSSLAIGDEVNYLDPSGKWSQGYKFHIPENYWVIDPSFKRIIHNKTNNNPYFFEDVVFQVGTHGSYNLFREAKLPFCYLPDQGFTYLKWSIEKRNRMIFSIVFQAKGAQREKVYPIGSDNFHRQFGRDLEFMRQASLAKARMTVAIARASMDYLLT